MSNRNLLFEFFAVWNSRSIRYGSLSANEEKRQKSVYFGVASITESILGVLFAAAGIWLMMNLSDFSDSSIVITVLLLIVGVALLIGALRTWIGAAVDLGYQMLMNKKPIRWIALAVLIAAVVGGVIAVIALA